MKAYMVLWWVGGDGGVVRVMVGDGGVCGVVVNWGRWWCESNGG